jgi:hypothetical protein
MRLGSILCGRAKYSGSLLFGNETRINRQVKTMVAKFGHPFQYRAVPALKEDA